MNSQFKNSSLGFYLYAIIIVIIAVSSIFVFWYMVSGYKLGTYGEDTILGSVYLGGMQEEEVEAKLGQRIERWLDDETIVFEVTFQGYSYEFDRELFYFDLETSIYRIADSETNDLTVLYQGTEREMVIDEIKDSPFLAGGSENYYLEELINDILADAGFMKSFSSKRLEDYIIDESIANIVIDSVDITVPAGIVVNDFIQSINDRYVDEKIISVSKELFDIVAELGGYLSDSEMTMLSKGMLELLLESNFAINEVHYLSSIDYVNYTIETFPNFGKNASVNQIIGHSFSFYNPNNSDYYFTVEKIDDSNITLSLVGIDFVDSIVVDIIPMLVQYTTQTTTNEDLLQNGYDGMIIEVNRTIVDIYDVVTYDKVILFEFYPPKKEIILD